VFMRTQRRDEAPALQIRQCDNGWPISRSRRRRCTRFCGSRRKL
jgi:hypothetical protein